MAFGQALGGAAFGLLGKTTIDLEDLNTHGVTEHRASLTRDDVDADGAGDSLSLNPEKLQAMLADAGEDADYLDVVSLARTRLRVEAASGPPEGTGLTMALGEVGLLLLSMTDGPVPDPVDPLALRAPKDRVEAWFRTEELPVEFGWRPAERVLTIADVSAMSRAVVQAQLELAQVVTA